MLDETETNSQGQTVKAKLHQNLNTPGENVNIYSYTKLHQFSD